MISNPKFKRQRGFTMIEILVVMIIIGLLAAIGLGNFTSTQLKSRDARRKSDLANIAKALELYYNDRLEYPAAQGGSIVGCGADFSSLIVCDWGTDFSVGETLYMVDLPADPTGAEYVYIQQDNWYALYTRLENNLDKDVPKPDGLDVPGVYVGVNCPSGGCNYRVSSTNAPDVQVIQDTD